MIVTLLTDYGHEDEFAGVCRAVIQGICPDCRVIDLTHGIPRHAVRQGALVLRNALPYTPVGVHLAVVDPEVGGERRAVALRLDGGRALVGPDNGLLSLAWERLGGVVEAVEVSRSPYRLEPVSATFHGRDIFAPVAAHLARGVELTELGERLEPEGLTRLDIPVPRVADGAVTAHVLAVDRFGNAGLNVDQAELAGTGLGLGRGVEVEAHGVSRQAVFARSFADTGPGGLLVYEDANRTLALAVNRGDAAAALGLAPDDEVRLRPR